MDDLILGVVIGRFQVETLTDGHRYVIGEALRNHQKVIIFVGCAQIRGTKYDPLDFPTRERMLRQEYPDATILPLYDKLSDKDWSEALDQAIRGIVPNLSGAKLYGGRDSFQKHYHGKHTAVTVESGIEFENGSAQRKNIGRVTRGSADFRAGIINACQNQWDRTEMCVDIALVRYGTAKEELGKLFILVGRKPSENKWRLPGGKVDKNESLENAACRELREETNMHVELSSLKYLGSSPCGDHRYKNAGEIGLLTALFLTEYTFDGPRAGDDLCEVKWVSLFDTDKEVKMIKNHEVLIEMVRNHYRSLK